MLAEHAAEGVRDLAEGRARLHGGQDGGDEVRAGATGGGLERRDGRPGRGGVPDRAKAREALDLRTLDRRIEAVQLAHLFGAARWWIGERVDAHDEAALRLERQLVFVGAPLDLLLREAGLDRRDHAAQLVD